VVIDGGMMASSRTSMSRWIQNPDDAVTAEHDGERALVEDGVDSVGEPSRMVAQAVGVEQARAASIVRSKPVVIRATYDKTTLNA
jgi:hypothetical protein